MGRRRRNAYWTLAGGQVTVEEVNQRQHEVAAEEPPPPEPAAAEEPEQPVVSTRRSLRQQAKKAAQTIHNIQQEEELAELEISEEEEVEEEDDEEEYVAKFTPLETPQQPAQKDGRKRNRRFLKEPRHRPRPVGRPPATGRQSSAVKVETTNEVLNRLLANRSQPHHGRSGHGGKRGRHHKRGRPRNIPPPPPLQQAPQEYHQELRVPHPDTTFGSLPLKVEIQEGGVLTIPVEPSGPRKRGRKRKVDLPMNLSMRNEAGELITPAARKQFLPLPIQHQVQQDPDWIPDENEMLEQEQVVEQHQHKKRGRQSAATAVVKNRFPFCSLCLSKNPPSDYIINYMSCPNEYQRMKRLFAYIYKDLRFPFMPFDMERENVFDYCDLPLCNTCIQLYREIYDSYAQIETARDQLKSKIERMVYQIQLSEQDPAVAQQLTSIKNSPDALMNKYCNFRKRFASYRPGDSRGDVETSSLVPASIARIRVISQAPKRTTGSQTFLTMGQFPATTPQLPVNSTTPSSGKTSTSDSSSSSSKAPNASVASKLAPVTIKKEIIDPSDDITVIATPTKSQTVDSKQSSAPSSSKPSDSKDKNPRQSSTTSSSSSITQQKTTSSPAVLASKHVAAMPTPPKPTVVPSNPVRSVPPSQSAITIVKTTGSNGASIIRKPPSIISQHSRLLAIATPTHKRTTLPTTGSGSSATSNSSNAVSLITVKDEPMDSQSSVDEDSSDPFFMGASSTPSKSSEQNGSANKGQSGSGANVFHKHKKLRIKPIRPYNDESSNDMSATTSSNETEEKSTEKTAAKESKEKEKDPSDEKKAQDDPEEKNEETVVEDSEKSTKKKDDLQEADEPEAKESSSSGGHQTEQEVNKDSDGSEPESEAKKKK